MLVERQGRLRFEAEVSLQGTVATLVTDGKNFSLLDLQEQVFKQGPACPENIASLLLAYIAIALMNHLIEGPLRDPASLNKPSTAP